MNIELNKIAGGVLGTLLFTMGLGAVSNLIYTSPKPAKPGYDLPVAAEKPAAGAAAAAVPVVPLPQLLAKADPAKGQDVFKACNACHTHDKGGGAKVGPPLYGVVGRPKASVAGFGYSDGMKAKGGDWSFKELDAFIANPRTDIPGTKMAFGGEKDAEKRANLLAYLRTLSDSPVPLPQ